MTKVFQFRDGQGLKYKHHTNINTGHAIIVKYGDTTTRQFEKTKVLGVKTNRNGCRQLFVFALHVASALL